jgi:hypothetical protein
MYNLQKSKAAGGEVVKKVADALGMTIANHESAEEFFLGAAARVGINGWELDRLLYNFTKDVLAAIGV